MELVTSTNASLPGTAAAPERRMPPSTRRILLLGTHGQANIGDELLLETFLDQLGRQHQYTVNSYSPDETLRSLEDRYDVAVIDTAATRLGLLRHIRDADVVVFGGGSIVKELYASVGRWRYATLVMVLGVVLAARMMRRPVLLCGVGVGPVSTRIGRLLAGAIVRSAQLVAVRDERSLTTCRELGLPDDRLIRIPDVVFVNDRDRFLPSGPGVPVSGARVRIALNLNRDIANGARWDDVLAELAEALDLVATRIPIEIHALPMQSTFKHDDDLSVLRSFLADRPEWNPVLYAPLDHHDVARIISTCDVVVSERLHAIVISAVLGRPAVGLVYDVKVAGLVEQLGIADRSVDINEAFDPAWLANTIVRTVREAPAERARLADRTAELRRELHDHFEDVRVWLDEPGRHTWAHDAAAA